MARRGMRGTWMVTYVLVAMLVLAGFSVPVKAVASRGHDTCGLVAQASFDDINASAVWLKQSTGVTCTLTSAAMMLRRAAMLNGNMAWASITETSLRPHAWVSAGLMWSFSYADMNVSHATLSGGAANVATLKGLLDRHPEGIVLYNGSHAVLLTDYSGETFHCADPAPGYPTGRTTIERCLKVRISNATAYWYVSSSVDPLEGDRGERVPDPTRNPIGVVDEMTGGAGTVRVRGWAFDPDTSDAIEIRVCVGADTTGEEHVIVANRPSQDVTDVFGVAGSHRFDMTVETDGRGPVDVRVYAVNVGDGTDDPELVSGVAHVVAPPPPGTLSVPAGSYVLRSKLDTNLVVDVCGLSQENGGNVMLGTSNGGDNQVWEVRDAGDTSLRLAARHSGMNLDVFGSALTSGANVVQGAESGLDNQRWYAVGNDDGTYSFHSRCSGLCLGVAGGVGENGANIVQSSPCEDDGQRFYLVATDASNLHVAYRTHVQNSGWQGVVRDGATAGTSGQSLRLEAIEIRLEGTPCIGSIECRSHIQDLGWEEGWRGSGTMSGTSGQGKRLEAVQLRLTGDMASHYDLWYRVHAQEFGWLGWAANGACAGTAGYGYRLEAIEVRLVARGAAAPGPSAGAFRSPVSYQTHVQDIGWQESVRDGMVAGTSGRGLRLEALRVSLPGAQYAGSVQYRTHVQGLGWEGAWRGDGQLSGTSGQGLRLEAVQLRLTGDMASHYDLWYRVHAQHFGWLGWASNGDEAGTTGYAYRLEALEIRLSEKGAAAPGSTEGALRSR